MSANKRPKSCDMSKETIQSRPPCHVLPEVDVCRYAVFVLLCIQPIHSNYNLFPPVVPCVCNWPEWFRLEMCAQHFLHFSWVSRDKRAYENSERKGPWRTFHLYTFIGGISLIRFERLDLRMMKRRGCAGTALPLARWSYWNLGGSAFIWVPVTKIILQGFRSLSAAQVQCRRQRLHTHTLTHTYTQKRGIAHLHPVC